jgi:spore maturation protein SpmB
VGIKRTRHALACGLAADAAGIVAAILVSYLFFG